MNLSKAFAVSVALAGLTILAGCQRETEIPFSADSGLHEVVFHAGWDPETRTDLQEDGGVWWSPGDEICLLVGPGSDSRYKLTSVETEASPKADFRGEIPTVATINGEYVVVYPYDETTSYNADREAVVLRLPERQMARENNFPDKAFKSLAVSADDHLYFENLFSGIKFSVAENGIQEIEFSTSMDPFLPAGTGLAGVTWFDLDGDCIISGSATRITVVAPDNQGFVPGKYYYAAVCPGTYNSGLIVTYKKEATEATLVLDEEVTFKRAIAKRLYDRDAGLEYHARAQKHATIAHFGYMLPSGIDKATITEAHFHVSSDKTTETMLERPDNVSEPIYFELDGTVAHYYTAGEVYKVARPADLFAGWLSLKRLDLSAFDVSSCVDFTGMFSGCLALEEIEFGDFNTSNAKSMHGMFYDCISLESLDLSSFNTSNVQSMYYMFTGCRALKELDLSNFDTHNVTNMGDLFNSCYRLEKLDISNFSSDKLEYAPELFCMCFSLLKLNLGSFDLSPLDNHFNTCYKLASRSRNCAVLCTPATKEALLSTDAKLRDCEPYIQWFVPGDVLPDLSMNPDPDLYYSTDYSQDKKVKMLNVASAGNGVDVVIMGEAYSDRLIEDGTYEADMTSAMEQIFSVEPFKSFRNLFNVYMVNAVSENETVGEFTAFGYGHDSWFGNGGIDRDDVQINEYVSQAVGRSEDRKVTTLIVVNQNTGDGVSMMNGSTSDSDHYDYPAKIDGVAFGSKSPDGERFRYVICHEFGHAFAALHDEYVSEAGEMETWESDYKKYYQDHLGWWANVSFTSDPALVGWHRFLEEGSGYDETEVSILEGALYSTGIWKSVDQSMMNAGGEFSVPAREAIYKKIHKVAYGEEWTYDFEDFVLWDRAIFAAPRPAMRHRPKPTLEYVKPIFKMEESVAPDGSKKVTVIMN